MERLRFLPGLIVVLLAVVFTAAVLGFGSFALHGLWKQHDAGRRFVPVQATVLKSEVRTSRGGKRGRTNYRSSIAYEYVVDGRTHAGERDSFGVRFNRGGRAEAEAAVAAHPTGSTMTVYVDPRDPATSVRRVGTDASDLGIVLFLTPFLGASLLLWAAAAKVLRRDPRRDGSLPWLRADDGRTASLRLSSTSPLMAGAIATIVAGFVAIFLSLLVLPPSAPAWAALTVLGGVLMAGTLGYWLMAIRLAAGRFDLHIDRDMRRLLLPARLHRRLGAEVAFSAIRGVEVEAVVVRTKHGKRTDHQVMLVTEGEDGTPRRGRLITSGDDEEAGRFAAWVRGEVGIGEGA